MADPFDGSSTKTENMLDMMSRSLEKELSVTPRSPWMVNWLSSGYHLSLMSATFGRVKFRLVGFLFQQ